MSKKTINPMEITREELLNLAAQKLVDDAVLEDSLSEYAKSLIQKEIQKLFNDELKTKVDTFLTEEMSRVLGQEICPVDIYGEKAGQPTTLRAVLAERAKVFWNVNVDSQGREKAYGGSPRHQVMFREIINDEFKKAIAANIDLMAKTFKDALAADAVAITKAHIDKIIHLK
jgi:hypothetical protein